MDTTRISDFLVIWYSLVINEPEKIVFYIFELLVLQEQSQESFHLVKHLDILLTHVEEFNDLKLVIFL